MLSATLSIHLIRFLIFFNVTCVPAIGFTLDCQSNVDAQGEIERQVICDDGVVYNLVTLEESIKTTIRIKEAALMETQLSLDKELIQSYENQIKAYASLVENYDKKSSEDDQTIDKILNVTLEPTPWYRSSEFSFLVGATTTVAAFVLWRYTEQFTE